VQAALYPIAGAAGLAGAGVLFLLARATSAAHESMLSWAWTGCFLGVVALMRTETRYELLSPGYKSLRSWLRLFLCVTWMFYYSIHEGDSVRSAFVAATGSTAIVFFVLRSRLLRLAWHAMQQISWMRTSIE
jgi:hypothetical protein